jgi:hypothetical protein
MEGSSAASATSSSHGPGYPVGSLAGAGLRCRREREATAEPMLTRAFPLVVLLRESYKDGVKLRSASCGAAVCRP